MTVCHHDPGDILFRKYYFPDVRGGVHGFGVAPENQRNVQQNNGMGNRFIGAHGWGRGQALGR